MHQSFQNLQRVLADSHRYNRFPQRENPHEKLEIKTENSAPINQSFTDLLVESASQAPAKENKPELPVESLSTSSVQPEHKPAEIPTSKSEVEVQKVPLLNLSSKSDAVSQPQDAVPAVTSSRSGKAASKLSARSKISSVSEEDRKSAFDFLAELGLDVNDMN